jgi:hypothetical protein
MTYKNLIKKLQGQRKIDFTCEAEEFKNSQRLLDDIKQKLKIVDGKNKANNKFRK